MLSQEQKSLTHKVVLEHIQKKLLIKFLLSNQGWEYQLKF